MNSATTLRARMPAKNGDNCKCGRGRLEIASSQCRGEYQIRYLRCASCGATDKSVLPAAEVRRRRFFTN